MKDRLEDFVRQNRDAFDVHEPDPSLWLRINPENTKQSKGRKSLRWLRYAAAVAVIFAGISAGFYYLSGAANSAEKLYGEFYKEIVEAEAYYSTLVSQKYEELKPYFTSSPELKGEIDNDFVELDEIYLELKDDLKENVGNPEVLEAMIQNYRVKVEILEDLLTQIKEKENQNYEEKKMSL